MHVEGAMCAAGSGHQMCRKFAAINFPHLGCHVAAESQECTSRTPIFKLLECLISNISSNILFQRSFSWNKKVDYVRIAHPSSHQLYHCELGGEIGQFRLLNTIGT
jgi:hypothetical protein